MDRIGLQDGSRMVAGEAEALVRISRGLDRPGLLGFVTFILPIILDGIFQSLAPSLFELNTIALLQVTRVRLGLRRLHHRTAAGY